MMTAIYSGLTDCCVCLTMSYMATSITIRVDEDVKIKAEQLAKEAGLSLSELMRLLLEQAVNRAIRVTGAHVEDGT